MPITARIRSPWLTACSIRAVRWPLESHVALVSASRSKQWRCTFKETYWSL